MERSQNLDVVQLCKTNNPVQANFFCLILSVSFSRYSLIVPKFILEKKCSFETWKKENKLYMVMLVLPAGRHTEQHDIFFGIGSSLKEMTKMKDFEAGMNPYRCLAVRSLRSITFQLKL
jgi:hypothetical protein